MEEGGRRNSKANGLKTAKKELNRRETDQRKQKQRKGVKKKKQGINEGAERKI